MDIFYDEESVFSMFVTRRLKGTSNTVSGFLTHNKLKVRPENASESSTEEFLAFAPRVFVSPAPVPDYSRRTSLLQDDASLQNLQAQFATQNAILLSVAVLGAVILLLINLIGILLCKGYFRRKAVAVSSNITACPQSLSRMRRNRYSNILQRFSLDPQLHPNQVHEPQTSSTSTTTVTIEGGYTTQQEGSHTGCRLCNAKPASALPLIDVHDVMENKHHVTQDPKRSWRVRSPIGSEQKIWHKRLNSQCVGGEGTGLSGVSGRSQAVFTSVGDHTDDVRDNPSTSEAVNVETYASAQRDVDEAYSSNTLSLSVPPPDKEISSV